MRTFFQICLRAARTFLAWIFSFVLWTFWLALAGLLLVQLYIATAGELELPDFVLRELESRLAAAGVRATFARTSFDPTGRVLLENVRVSLPSYNEPVVTARSAYVRLNPLMLIVGRVEPREIHVTGAAITVPAMLSPTGRGEQIVQGLEATLLPASRSLTISQLNARAAGVFVSARGVVPLPRETGKPAPDALAQFIASEFPKLCRQAQTWTEQLAQLEEPMFELEFVPSESGAAGIGITVLARSARIEKPISALAVNIRASTRLLLFGDLSPGHVELRLDELRLPENATVRGVHAFVFGRLRPREGKFDLREVALTADAIAVGDLNVDAVSARIYPRPLPRIEAVVTAGFLGAPLAVRGEADYETGTATVQLAGPVPPAALELVSRRIGTNVRESFDFDTFSLDRAEAQFGPKWKFEKLQANIRLPTIRARGITMSDTRAELELTDTRLYSPEAFARVGTNYARGSYEHDLKTHDYRFLLDGHVQPLAIANWFRAWWPNFFQQFEFPVAPPDASVDVRSSWRDGSRARLFIFADVPKPVFRGTALDHLRTRLFVRPAFYDALETLVTRGEGLARGRFTYIADPVSHDWHTLDLAINSTLDLKTTEQLLGSLGTNVLAPFQLASTPELKVRGRFSGAAAPGGANENVRIEARSAGEFRFHHFPLSDVSFVATLKSDEIVVDDVVATIAGGAASGHARVWGQGAERRLGFDFALRDAALGQTAAGLEEFFAHQEKRTPAPPGKFVQQKANVKLTLAASAEGSYDNALTFRGRGNAALQGAEIGEVSLLGALSELLKFTALRFTEARANFRIEGPKLVFPEVSLRGANSAIDAHGEYSLDRHQLEFNAKISPFQESDSLLKSVVGVVLAPFTAAFEVKLTGTLEKPHWALTLGSAKAATDEKTPANNPLPPSNGGTSGTIPARP